VNIGPVPDRPHHLAGSPAVPREPGAAAPGSLL